jgi:dTDP-4-dehydrorhamnose 3,5-epimerase
MPFTFEPTEIPGMVRIRPQVFGDARGFFLECYKASDFQAHGIGENFVQDNLSLSVRGILRGLHFQRDPFAQGKLVWAPEGTIYDVCVDLRADSPAYGKWQGFTLSSESPEMLYLPPGCAHGFCVLSERALFMYKVTKEFSLAHDGGIVWNDPDLNIPWPISEPKVSEKDTRLPRFRETDPGFRMEA